MIESPVRSEVHRTCVQQQQHQLCFQDERGQKLSLGPCSTDDILVSVGLYESNTTSCITATFLTRAGLQGLVNYLHHLLQDIPRHSTEPHWTNQDHQPYCLKVCDERRLPWRHEFNPPPGLLVASIDLCRCDDPDGGRGKPVWFSKRTAAELICWIDPILDEAV